MKTNEWMVVESDNIIIVVPDNDIAPHGRKLTDTEYDLDVSECACDLQIRTGSVANLDAIARVHSFYGKPLVIHNAFDGRP